MNLLGKINSCSLRTNFLLPVSAMLILSILVISGYLTKRQADSIRQELRASGETMIRIIAKDAESGVLFESQYDLDELLSILSRFEAVTYGTIANNEGTVLSRFGVWRED